MKDFNHPKFLFRFASLKPDQDKISGQPPKPRVEMINTGIKEENQVLVDSNGFVYHKKVQ